MIDYESNREPFDDEREQQDLVDYHDELAKRQYVIYSHEHLAWWGPNCKGYTKDLDHAGRYDLTTTAEIVLNHIPPGEEVAVRSEVAEMHTTTILRMLQRRVSA